MLKFKPSTNVEKYDIIDEEGDQIGAIMCDEGKWFLTDIYCGGFGVDSMKVIRRKLKELNNANI